MIRVARWLLQAVGGVFARHAALRARDPPELEAAGAGTAAFAFDQSPSWDPAAAPSDPGYNFDQTLN